MAVKAVQIGSPKCDICNRLDAIYDGKTIMGPWAYMCHPCYREIGDTSVPPTQIEWSKE